MTDVKLPPLPQKLLHDTAPIWSAITEWEMSSPGKESELRAKVIDEEITAAMTEYARLAVLQERERCAKICDDIEDKAYALWKITADPTEQGRELGACHCADAIRKGE